MAAVALGTNDREVVSDGDKEGLKPGSRPCDTQSRCVDSRSGGGTRSQGRYGKRGGPWPGGYSDAKGSHRPEGRGGGEGNGCAHAPGLLGK